MTKRTAHQTYAALGETDQECLTARCLSFDGGIQTHAAIELLLFILADATRTAAVLDADDPHDALWDAYTAMTTGVPF